MADGFKIAEGFVEVVAEDNTRTGLSRISAVIERWAAAADRKVKIDVDVDNDELSRTDTMLGRVTASLGQFTDRAKDAILGATRVGTTVASLASLAGPATLAVLALADSVAAVTASAAAMAPAIALAPSVIAGWQFLKFTLAGIGEQMGEALKPLGEAFQRTQEHAGKLATQQLPELAAQFQRVNLPNIADAMNRIGEYTDLVVGTFGRWINSAPGVKIVKDTVDGVAAAFERAAPSIVGAGISLLDMANRADVVDRLTAIGEAIRHAADRFNSWTDRVTSADIDGAFRRIGDAAQFVVDKVHAVREIIGWLADHQSVITGVSDALAGVGITLGLATGNWVAVVAGAVTLILNHFDRVAPFVQEMAGKVADAFNVIANDPWVQKIAADIREIAGLIRDDFAAGIAWLGDRWGELKPKVAEAWAVLGPMIDGFLKDENVRTGLRFWADTLGIIAVGFIGLGAAMTAMTGLVSGTLGAFLAWVTGTFVNNLITGFQAVVSFLTAIPGQVSAAWSAVTATVAGAVAAVLGFFDQIPARLSAAWQTIVSTASAAWQSVVATVQSAGTSIAAAASSIWQSVVSTASAAWQSVVATVAAVPGQVVAILQQMVTTVPYMIGFMTGQVVALFIGMAAAVVGALIALPGQIASLFTQAKDQAVSLTTSMISTVVAFFAALPGQVAAAVSAMAAQVQSWFTQARNQAVEITTSLVSTVVSTAATLPGRVMSAISSLVSTVTSVFTQARTQATSVTTSMVSTVVSTAQTLPGRVASAISSLASQVASVFNSARTQAVSVMTGLVSQVVSIVAGLPGKAAAAIGNIGGVLAGAGRQLIQGFIDGVRSMIPSLDGVLGSITSRIPQVKGPPEKDARLLEPSGRLIMGGLIRGIDAGRPALEQHLSDLTGVIGGLGTSIDAGQASGSAGGTHYHFAPGAVTLDASKIRDLRDLLDMLDGVRSTARQYGAVPIGA